MLRTPLFTATVVLTVALAIAANATIFYCGKCGHDPVATLR
jgi:hypothetical protein